MFLVVNLTEILLQSHFFRFKSLAIQELNPKIWMVVGSAAGKPDVWVSICVCFGMPWFQGSQPVTSFESPNFLGWCSQNIWQSVPIHNERESTSGQIPKSTVLTCKLIVGCAITSVWLFLSMDSSYTCWMSHTSPPVQLGSVFLGCYWICNGNFLLLFNCSLNKVIVLTQSPLRQGEKYFPNNYCSRLSWVFESNRHLKIYSNSNL